MSKYLWPQDNFTKIPNEISRCPNLSPIEFRVYVFLRSYFPCHPSYAEIESKTGLSYASVKRAIKTLKLRRLIYYRQGSNTKNESNLYFFNESPDSWDLESKFCDLLKKKEPTSETLVSGSNRPEGTVSQTLRLGSNRPSNKTKLIRLNNNSAVPAPTKDEPVDSTFADQVFEKYKEILKGLCMVPKDPIAHLEAAAPKGARKKAYERALEEYPNLSDWARIFRCIAWLMTEDDFWKKRQGKHGFEWIFRRGLRGQGPLNYQHFHELAEANADQLQDVHEMLDEMRALSQEIRRSAV